MQALILAAGMGKRLKSLTKDNTKCMIKVNGETIIERMLSQLDGLGLSKIVIVTGYEGEKLVEFVSELEIDTPLEFIHNEIYYRTNNIYSLYLAKDCLLEEDTLLLESDLVFEDAAINRIIDDPYPNLALVAKFESWMDGTVVEIDEENNIKSFIDRKGFEFEKREKYFKTVNIYKFGREFSETHYVPFLEAYCKALGNNEYYEQVLKVIALLDNPGIKASLLDGEDWYEIDDIQDLDIAETIFEGDKIVKLNKFKKRYGGYWRFPGLVDFCYLVNPFYPPGKMMDEMNSDFTTLIGQYPSGMEVNSLLAGKFFGLPKEMICVGNGAAELIVAIMRRFPENVGIISPGFEEYLNRVGNDNVVSFVPENKALRYSAEDVMAYYQDRNIDMLVLVNPDNPSGNCIGKAGLENMIEWAMHKGIKIVVDESFVDFADDEGPGTLLEEEILEANKNLVVIKSISKSYGVPGLRLGVLASGDTELVSRIKDDVAIWNINSFAEFFMQIQGKYRKEYEESLEKIKEARRILIDELSSFKQLRVLPSQANYVMCEVVGVTSAEELSATLLCDYDIFIKDLSGKIGISGEYVRIAVRCPEDNDRLVSAFKDIFERME